MSYTTTAKIRDDAGFKNNTYILDTSIDAQRLRAYGVINSYVGIRYKIPDTSNGKFVGSTAAALLESIEILLGSGYLLQKEYGQEARDTDKDGYRRVADAMTLLSDIRDNNIALYDIDGNLMDSVADNNRVTGHIRGFPVTTTDSDYDRRFSVTDKF